MYEGGCSAAQLLLAHPHSQPDPPFIPDLGL